MTGLGFLAYCVFHLLCFSPILVQVCVRVGLCVCMGMYVDMCMCVCAYMCVCVIVWQFLYLGGNLVRIVLKRGETSHLAGNLLRQKVNNSSF